TPKFTSAFGKPYTYDYERLKQIAAYNRYTMWREDIFAGGKRAHSKIILGFEFNVVEPQPYPVLFLGIVCNRNHSRYHMVKDAIERQGDFDYTEEEYSIWGWYETPVSNFLSMENQFDGINQWFSRSIDRLIGFKENTEKLGWK
ncbi:hypothetical protein ACFFQG_32425, partial [Shinella granuli]